MKSQYLSRKLSQFHYPSLQEEADLDSNLNNKSFPKKDKEVEAPIDWT